MQEDDTSAGKILRSLAYPKSAIERHWQIHGNLAGYTRRGGQQERNLAGNSRGDARPKDRTDKTANYYWRIA